MKIFIIFAACLFLGLGNLRAQNKIDKHHFPETSVFSDFEELGILKTDFVEIYGYPTFKEMYLNDAQEKVNVYHYIEHLLKKLKSGLRTDNIYIEVRTSFTFVNEELVDQRSEIVVEPLGINQLLQDLTVREDPEED
ncbi:hypothetical protein GCM10007049_25020 [Echinicola pacifica]|uniref:Uncharacterized protein n=1 Tax=Echinicola pacifica TaxID=346377 RepID=A0A918Q3I2_9BACT|nr:hypothetical protein [Echinicola pacifica]GGZ31054.1 hypothetical protein GCM10007049_25020 [Echinicola pacifica]